MRRLKGRILRYKKILWLGGILLFASTSFPQADPSADEALQESAKFAEVYAAVEQNYTEAVDPDKTIWDGGIRGMLSILDPFSSFFDRDQFELLEQQARGEALGFGSILYVQPGKVIILQTAEGSPSWRAGLGPGDEIVSINGTRLDRLDFQSLIQLLQRSRSQPVTLGVVPSGKVVAQDFKLQPAEVALPTVDKAFQFSPEIGYIHLTGFELKTAQEVIDALTRLRASSLKGLILDLRDNHGGILDAAIGVTSLFLKPDLLLLTVRGRAVPEKASRTVPAAFHFEGPLIVLVNRNTASAAEVVAAALQEHDRAVIAGESTFGKGVVETVMPLGEKTGLALTTAQYFTPSGRSIQRPLPGTALEAHLDPGSNRTPAFHTDNGRITLAGGGVTPDAAIASWSFDPWVTFLNQRGTFTTFASDYLTLHGKVNLSFDPGLEVLGQFKEFLTRGQIRVPEEYWKADQAYLKLKIKAEVISLVFGLSRGDEVEVRGDPQVQKAATLFPKVGDLLRGPAAENPQTVGRFANCLRAEIDEAAWSALYCTSSRPFDPPQTSKIAVKVINHYGDEVPKVYDTNKGLAVCPQFFWGLHRPRGQKHVIDYDIRYRMGREAEEMES